MLEFYEIERQRQLVVQEISSELKEQLEAKAGELREMASERDAQAKEKSVAQRQIAKLEQQLEEKGGELQKVVVERDARAKEKSDAQQAVEELKQQLERERKQLEAQSSTLLLSQKSLKTKESELQELQDDYHIMRLRHLRQRSR